MKILILTKQLKKISIMLVLEFRMVIVVWAHSQISFGHKSSWYPFMEPRLIIVPNPIKYRYLVKTMGFVNTRKLQSSYFQIIYCWRTRNISCVLNRMDVILLLLHTTSLLWSLPAFESQTIIMCLWKRHANLPTWHVCKFPSDVGQFSSWQKGQLPQDLYACSWRLSKKPLRKPFHTTS